MSARLNFNELRYFSWKGRTITQITSSIKKNINENENKYNFFIANPLKIYRREIANTGASVSRSAISIDELNRPNGAISHSAMNTNNGLKNEFDNIIPNNVCENPGPKPNLCVLSPGENAKRRVRSSGNVKRQFDISKNNDTYYTSSNQYLTSRNRTFQQNQYNYIRQGNSTAKPGDSLSTANIYSPNGLNHCQKYHIATPVSFKYQWVDNIKYPVSIPAGYYTLEDINAIFKQTMLSNYHYYILATAHNINDVFVFNDNFLYNQNIAFLLNIGYNSTYNKVELQAVTASIANFPTEKYMINTGANSSWVTPSVPLAPGFNILDDNDFKNAIGYTPGYYPNNTTSKGEITNVAVSNVINDTVKLQTSLSSFNPGIQPLYVKLFYKPNNSQFAQQGAVSSSSMTTRIKYNSITSATIPYKNAYGTSVANALAYGVPEFGYTNKDKIGYPNNKTPVFSKYTDDMKICSSTHISG